MQNTRTITFAFILFELFPLESHYKYSLNVQYDTKKGVETSVFFVERQILVYTFGLATAQFFTYYGFSFGSQQKCYKEVVCFCVEQVFL